VNSFIQKTATVIISIFIASCEAKNSNIYYDADGLQVTANAAYNHAELGNGWVVACYQPYNTPPDFRACDFIQDGKSCHVWRVSSGKLKKINRERSKS